MCLNYTVSAAEDLLCFALAVMFPTGHNCFRGFKEMNEYISTKSMKSSLIIKKKKKHEKKPTTHLNHKMTKINISI